MSGASSRTECVSCWRPQRSGGSLQWIIKMQNQGRREELRGRIRELAIDRMHRARTDSNPLHLDLRVGSEAIGHPQQQAEELKSQLLTAGATTCLSNRHQDQQSAPDLALAKLVRMMQGIGLSYWRRRLKRMKKERLARRVLVIVSGPRSFPKALRCRETRPSTMAL